MPSAPVMYSGSADKIRTNVDLRVNTDSRSFVQLGLGDIGEANRLNLQLGQQGKVWGGRFGVIEGKVGAGIDIKMGRDFKISADAYDPNDFRLKLRSELLIGPDTYLVGESFNLNKDVQRSFFLGVRKTF